MTDFSIDSFIAYLEQTKDEDWVCDIVRSKDGNANCLFGHLFAFANDDKTAQLYWDHFEYWWATTYMIYPVNDGKNPNYRQDTPKQRCLAYLRDLISGKEQKTFEIMESMTTATRA